MDRLLTSVIPDQKGTKHKTRDKIKLYKARVYYKIACFTRHLVNGAL